MQNEVSEVILDNFWNMYEQASYCNAYYGEYLKKIRSHNTYINIAAALVSLIALSGIAFQDIISKFWPIVVLVSQTLIIFRDQREYKEKTCALTFYITESDKILNNIEMDWVKIQSGYLYDDNDIGEKANRYRKKLDDIRNNFLRSYSLDSDKSIEKIADEKVNQILAGKHGKR